MYKLGEKLVASLSALVTNGIYYVLPVGKGPSDAGVSGLRIAHRLKWCICHLSVSH